MPSDGRTAVRLAVALAAALAGADAAAECAPDVADLRLGDTEVRFNVEVVDDEAERARGLMFREELPRFDGMLFVYEREAPVAFWMKNTLIPLDMLFFDAAGRLIRVHENAVPGDLTRDPERGPGALRARDQRRRRGGTGDRAGRRVAASRGGAGRRGVELRGGVEGRRFRFPARGPRARPAGVGA